MASQLSTRRTAFFQGYLCFLVHYDRFNHLKQLLTIAEAVGSRTFPSRLKQDPHTLASCLIFPVTMVPAQKPVFVLSQVQDSSPVVELISG